MYSIFLTDGGGPQTSRSPGSLTPLPHPVDGPGCACHCIANFLQRLLVKKIMKISQYLAKILSLVSWLTLYIISLFELQLSGR